MSSTQLICPSCASANPQTARFCAGCGVSLLPRCSTCGAELLDSARYCNACGAPVHAVGAAAGRKVVTVLFADLAGSTALQEALDAESVRSVMARFYGAMRAVIERHEGRLEKFIGDAVVAVFGAPVVREDDALRAVRAAMAMASALSDLNEELERDFGVRLDMRTGVNTGELVVAQGSGDGGLEDADIVVGDVMNTAARLEQAAGAGEALIGEGTRRLVRHAVQLEPVAPLVLKGKSKAVRAFRLISVERQGEEMTTETTLIGRHSDLECLRAALDDAIGARACRLVTVIGSPGVGKTRLAQEFSRAISEEAIVVEGHCELSGEGITLLPVAEVLRSLAAIGEADPPETVRAKLGALVEGDAERERLIERVAGVLGVASPSSAQETFWALRRGLELVAQRQPIVIVLDDLHWGQPMFLDLVEHLIEWVSDAPVLLLALARPELREVREALASAGRRAFDVIELAPLDESQSEALVSGLLGGAQLPSALAERILRSSEGNPLFLGEMLRMLIDEGVLKLEGQEWVSASELADVEVPPTIHALMSARIERLGSDERSVVERAAVIGKEFYRGAVAELVAPPIKPRIDGHLESLRRKDMVEPEGTYWIDEPVYRFHHVLIRDAAYRSLLKEARAELHERFADWLKEKAGELVGEHEEVIAYHLEQAHCYRRELGPLDERGRSLGSRAAERLHSAGRRALAREDLAAASNLLARALECDTGSEQEILWDLCEVLLSAGDTSKAAMFVERFTVGADDDPARCARARVLQAQLANLGAERAAGGGPAAVEGTDASTEGTADNGDGVGAEAVENAARTLAELGDIHGEAKAWQVAAGAHARLGQVGAAEEALDRALAAARAANDTRRVTAILTGAPRAALWGPSPVVRASGRCLDVVRILRMTPGNRHVEAIALRCQAVLEGMRGRADAAREILAAGRATLEELGLTLELRESALHAGIVELLAGDPRAAVDHLREAREGFESLGVASGAAQAAAMLASALIQQGDRDDEAIEQTRFAERHGGEDLKTTITWCSARAQALARAGEIEQALSLAERAVALAQPTDALADKADASMALAQVLLAAGREEEASQTASAARELYEAKGHTVGVERATRLSGTVGHAKPGARGTAHEEAARRQLGDLAPETWYAELMRRVSDHDLARCLELYGEDWLFEDHRALAWEPAQGQAGAEQLLGSGLASAPDFELVVDEVLACDDQVIAVRQRWRGHASDGAGEFEVRVGLVSVIEGGQLTRSYQYEYEDDASMLARYAKLGGGQSSILGDQLPERFWATFQERANVRDYEALAELIVLDWEWQDHRALGWEQAHGREQAMAIMRSTLDASPDIRMEFDEVLACDERVIAVRMAWRGEGRKAGDLEVEVGAVLVVEDGLWRSVDFYAPEDPERMLARYRELGGKLEVLGARPPERYLANYTTRFCAHDLVGLLELHAEDCVLVDHRRLSWETARGRSGAEEQLRSVFTSPDVTLEIDGVLACDDRLVAVALTGRGTTPEGGGEFEVQLGAVIVIENGQLVSSDYYEHDDHDTMLARYAELGGLNAVTATRPPERVPAEFARCLDARDVDAMIKLFAEDCVFTDHRKLGWETVRGRDQIVEGLRAFVAASPNVRYEVDEVLACDDRVIAHRVSYRGKGEKAGPFDYPVGTVAVIQDGRWVSSELYEPEDRHAMIARYAELGGGQGPLGERPPERYFAEQARRYAARDIDGLLELVADDWVLVDHRAVGWEPIRGHKGARAGYQSVFTDTTDSRLEIEEVLACDERVIALRAAYHGHATYGDRVTPGSGEYALAFGYVAVIEQGRCLSADQYEPEDREAMLARFQDLSRQHPALGDRPPERFVAAFLRHWQSGDIAALVAIHSKDFVLTDHRRLGWEAMGRDDAENALRSYFRFASSSDVRLEIDELLACDDRVVALQATLRGEGVKVGQLDYSMGLVCLIEDCLWMSLDIHEPDDREGMLARYAELGGTGSRSTSP